MNLSDLNLNRYLYRDYNESPDSLNSGNTYITNSPTAAPANSVAPGSVIQSVLLQSSPGDDRVEINPDDHFYAYNAGNVVVSIGKDGIFADQSTIVNEDVETINVSSELNVDGDFVYHGTLQPVIFTGKIDSTGTPIFLPVGWTATKFGVGTYIITHNLNSVLPYVVVAAPIDGHFRYQQSASNTNNFIIDWQETSYGSVTVGVSGGGGGSVTVPGVRVAPGEVGVDTTFEFIMAYYG